jgi:RNA polymerase sigma-70 factor (ECF subfamily)
MVMGARISDIESVYRHRYTAFRQMAATIAGTPDEARDVVQDAFAEAIRKRASFRGEGPLEGWIWRIALRLAFARRRSDPGLPLAQVGESAIPDPEADPELAEAVRQLAPRRRLVVFLRYFGDLSYAQIAEICGISEGTVAATLAQAHNELGAALEPRRGASSA